MARRCSLAARSTCLLLLAAAQCAVLLLSQQAAAAAEPSPRSSSASQNATAVAARRHKQHAAAQAHHKRRHKHQHKRDKPGKPTFERCMKAITGAHSSPLLVLPNAPKYAASIKVFNPRFSPKPAALLFAESTEQVAAAVTCARAHGVKVSPSAGRQSFIGASVQDGYLVIDVTRMASVVLSDDKRTISVGAGISVGLMQSAIHSLAREHNLPGLMGPTLGSCTWVGVAGFTLGGGFGWLGRYLGLGCDSLVSVRAVLADGSVVTADKDNHAGLFWASCGGGGGTFAVATRLTFRTHILPNFGRVAYVVLKSPLGEAATVQAALDFQAALPRMDSRLGLDGHSFGSGFAGPQFSIVGVFLGTKAEAQAALEAVGLAKYISTLQEKDSLYQANLDELAPKYTALPPFQYVGPSPWQQQPWNASAEQQAFLAGLMHGRPVSIVGGFDYYSGTWWYSQSRLLGIAPRSTFEALASYLSKGFAACEASKKEGKEEGSWYCFLDTNGHALGGKYAARAPDATAFVHRDKVWLIGAQFVLGGNQSQAVKDGTVAAATEFARLLDDASGGSPEAYVNYQIPETSPPSVWQPGYFGSNYARLQRIKAKYDPRNVFGKVQTVTLPQESA